MRSILAVIGICFLATAAIAQAPAGADDICTEEFAQFLVGQQVAEAANVREANKRVGILLRAADFLWKRDEPTARGYFAEAYKTAANRYREKGFESRSDGKLLVTAPDLRFEVARAIAPKDAEWAKRLSEELLAEYEKEAADRKDTNPHRLSELNDILRIANEASEANPQLAMHLYRRAMRQPLDYHWFWALYGVGERNPDLASALYRELLVNYAGSTPRRMLFLSAFPFASDRILGPDKMGFGASVPAGFEASPDLQRQFLVTFFNRVASYTSNPDELSAPAESHRYSEAVYMAVALREVEPIVMQRFPQLLQQYTAARSSAESALSEANRRSLDELGRRDESFARTFDERIKELEEADSKGTLTDDMIVSLIIREKLAEPEFRKLESWIDKIKDSVGRPAAADYFWFRRAKLALEESGAAIAEKHLGKIGRVELRAILYFEITEKQLENVNDAATVYQTLNNVGKTARQAEDPVVTARILLALANRYEKLNRSFAMAEFADAVKEINRVENADIFASGVRHQITVDRMSFFAGLAMPRSGLEDTVNLLAKHDLGMTVSHAKAISDPYIRTLAVIAAAKNCTAKPTQELRRVN